MKGSPTASLKYSPKRSSNIEGANALVETERAGDRLRQTTNLCPVLSPVLYQSPVGPLQYRDGALRKVRFWIT
jgi:hypothetical protein